MEVRFRFFSAFGKMPVVPEASLALPLAAASAWSNHVAKIGFSAIILLWDSVKDSNRHMVDWLKDPTPGSFKLASALPTSACVTPNFILRCLKCSAKASSSLGSVSGSLLCLLNTYKNCPSCFGMDVQYRSVAGTHRNVVAVLSSTHLFFHNRSRRRLGQARVTG